MRILALDLGTHTGWAHFDGVEIHAATLTLATDRDLKLAKRLRMDRRLDPRAIKFALFLQESLRAGRIDWLVFEDVKFAKSRAQAHLWGTFRGILWATAALKGIDIECVYTGKLKKFATGSGSADKDQMAAALVRKYPGRFQLEKGLVRDSKHGTLLDDNAVDALHLLHWAVLNLKT